MLVGLQCFGFFWTALLGIAVVLAADVELRWLAYGLKVASARGFIGMMVRVVSARYRCPQPLDAGLWRCPSGVVAAADVLRHTGAAERAPYCLWALAAAIRSLPSALFLKLWNVSLGLADLGHRITQRGVCAEGRRLLRPGDCDIPGQRRLLQPSRRRPGPDERTRTRARPIGRRRRFFVSTRSRMSSAAPTVSGEGGPTTRSMRLTGAFEKPGPCAQRTRDVGARRSNGANKSARAFEHYDRAVALGRDDAKVHCDRSYAHFPPGTLSSGVRRCRSRRPENASPLHQHGGTRAGTPDAGSVRGRSRELRGSSPLWPRTARLHEDVLHRMGMFDANADAAQDEREERA